MSEFVSDIFSDLFNRCFNESVYPCVVKLSRIILIYKKGKSHRLENHRPISVLCNVGKIFDAIIHDRITNYFIDGDILSSNQFGFRKDKNTELACIHLVDKILPSFIDGQYCMCFFRFYSLF